MLKTKLGIRTKINKRPIKVVVKNLHHSWTSEDVVQNQRVQHFRVISAIIKLKFKTKEPLYMFLVSFESAEDIKRIYAIKSVLHRLVKIEQPKKLN